jgi:hypothetical protein
VKGLLDVAIIREEKDQRAVHNSVDKENIHSSSERQRSKTGKKPYTAISKLKVPRCPE